MGEVVTGFQREKEAIVAPTKTLEDTGHIKQCLTILWVRMDSDKFNYYFNLIAYNYKMQI